MALLAGGLSSIVLYTSLGGTTYRWWSAQMVALLALGIGLSVGFVVAERYAAEPLVPLHLFRNRVFSVASAVGFIVGISLFGSVTYIPLYLQVVKGASPTQSGLEMLPLMAGVLIASIGSGQLITRFGRYKLFPILGTALMVVGMLLLSRLGTGTSTPVADAYMLVLGLGLGFTMQVLVLAVQNAVDYANLGVATATATLFRSMGGTVGVPIFGAIFANKLASELAGRLPADVAAQLPAHLGPSQVDGLPPAIRDPYIEAYAAAIRPIFLIAAAIAAVGFGVTWLLQERPLRETVADQGIGDSFAAPREATSIDELETRLASSRRHQRRLVYDRLTTRRARPHGRQRGSSSARGARRRRRCRARGLMPEASSRAPRRPSRALARRAGRARLTAAGADAAARMNRRAATIQALLEDWEPELHPEVLQMIRRFARSLSTGPPAPEPA